MALAALLQPLAFNPSPAHARRAPLAPRAYSPLAKLEDSFYTELASAGEKFLDCIASADSGEEIEECEVAYDSTFFVVDAPQSNVVYEPVPGAPAAAHALREENRDKLQRANVQLLDCIASAESGDGIEECEITYDVTFDEVSSNTFDI